ncbi:MAG TPA: hypothetical protein DCY88_08005 [Cyanobacteria bacterium UBA11372]|nr:hypothetical protein [Cyanobacteria bacterium UBA11372]
MSNLKRSPKALLSQHFPHYPVSSQNFGLCENLHVNAKTQRGYTPLHLAAQCNSKDVASVLIANGADVNAKDQYVGTPLAYTAGFERKELVELLKRYGAKY